MKPTSIAFGAALVALASGTGGFFLGKAQNVSPASDAQGPAVLAAPVKSGAKTSPISSRTDYTSLRAELEAEKNPLARFKLAIQNLEGWIDSNPEAAMAWLKSQPPTARLQDVIRNALVRYAKNDPKGAAEWSAANLTGNDLNNSLILIAEEWAERDGLQAASWISAMPATPERDAALESTFFSWAANDPAAAIDFLGKNVSSPQIATMLRYATYAGWAKTDPEGAVAASLESSRVHNDPAQFANTIANWAIMDLEASSQWLLDHVKSGDQRAISVQELATIFAGQSPTAGLEWIAKLDPGTERENALNRLAAEWGSADPAGAAKWATTQSLGTLQPDSAAQILHNFLAADAPAFETWRDSLPEGPLKQQAIQVSALAEGSDEE